MRINGDCLRPVAASAQEISINYNLAGPTAKMAVLQQTHLRTFRHRLGKANADSDEADRFSRSAKRF